MYSIKMTLFLQYVSNQVPEKPIIRSLSATWKCTTLNSILKSLNGQPICVLVTTFANNCTDLVFTATTLDAFPYFRSFRLLNCCFIEFRLCGGRFWLDLRCFLSFSLHWWSVLRYDLVYLTKLWNIFWGRLIDYLLICVTE